MWPLWVPFSTDCFLNAWKMKKIYWTTLKQRIGIISCSSFNLTLFLMLLLPLVRFYNHWNVLLTQVTKLMRRPNSQHVCGCLSKHFLVAQCSSAFHKIYPPSHTHTQQKYGERRWEEAFEADWTWDVSSAVFFFNPNFSNKSNSVQRLPSDGTWRTLIGPVCHFFTVFFFTKTNFLQAFTGIKISQPWPLLTCAQRWTLSMTVWLFCVAHRPDSFASNGPKTHCTHTTANFYLRFALLHTQGPSLCLPLQMLFATFAKIQAPNLRSAELNPAHRHITGFKIVWCF